MSTAKQRVRFTSADDKYIIQQVLSKGKNINWKEVGKNLTPERTGRHCRERYQQYLAPGLDTSPWTQQEDEKLLKLYRSHGRNWAVLKLQFPQRPFVSIRNRILYVIRHQKEIDENAQILAGIGVTDDFIFDIVNFDDISVEYM